MFVFINVVCNPLLATAEAPIPGKRTTFTLISCLRVQGKLFRLTHRDVWNVRQNQITTSKLPQGLAGLPVSWEQLCSERACQAEMTAFVLEISFPVLGKGLDKVHRGAIAPLPSSPSPSLLPATWIPTGHISYPPTNYCALCVDEEWSDWLCRGCLGGQSCVHFTLCPFGLSPAVPSERSHGQQSKKTLETERKVGKRETSRQKMENFFVCSLQCNVISCLGNRKCVMFSAGLKFTFTPVGTSSGGAQHSLYCKTLCCLRLHNKRKCSEPEFLCCVCVQWEGTAFPLGKVH